MAGDGISGEPTVSAYPGCLHGASRQLLWDFSPALGSDWGGYRISWVYCPAQQTLLPEQPPRPLARLEAEIAPKKGTGKNQMLPKLLFQACACPSPFKQGSQNNSLE